MRADQCSACGHFLPTEGWCSHGKKPIRKIKGCSYSPSGKLFFRAKQAKEAIRLRVAGAQKGGREVSDYAFLKDLASPGAHAAEIKELLQAVGLDDERYTTVLDGLMNQLQGVLGVLLDCEHSGDPALGKIANAVSAGEAAQQACDTGAGEATARVLADAVWEILSRRKGYIARATELNAVCTLFRLSRGFDGRDGGCDTVGVCKYAPRARVMRWDGEPADGLEEK